MDLPQIASIMDALLIPVIGGCALALAKLTHGELARTAEKNFYAILVVSSVITLRTVILCEQAWLFHTTALAALILAALTIPGHETHLASRPSAKRTRLAKTALADAAHETQGLAT